MSLGRLLVAISMLAFTAITSAQGGRGSVTGT
jgi:hypothetical protein